MKKIFTICFAVILPLIMLTSCLKSNRHVGYSTKAEDVNKIEVGATRKAVVKRILGTPSAVSSYGNETWYYISTEEEFIAFLKPKIKSQDILAIEFDEYQTVSNITNLNENDARNVSINGDATKTFARNETILQQLLGNVGRFNTNRQDAASN